MRTVQRSALCRSRRELSNEYLLAKFGFDTAENEPCKVCPLSKYRSHQIPQVDLKMVFKPYGNVLAVEDHPGAGGGALITYDHFDNAAMAVKALSGKALSGVQGTLKVTFAPPTAASATAPSGPPPPESMGRKFICRIDIGIPNDRDFQVAERDSSPDSIGVSEVLCRFSH